MLFNYLVNTKVRKVILFGSYSKNMATKVSDIDLVIDTNGLLRGFAFLDLVLGLEKLFNKKVNGFECYEIIENSTIDNEIKQTGIVVYENVIHET